MVVGIAHAPGMMPAALVAILQTCEMAIIGKCPAAEAIEDIRDLAKIELEIHALEAEGDQAIDRSQWRRKNGVARVSRQ